MYEAPQMLSPLLPIAKRPSILYTVKIQDNPTKLEEACSAILSNIPPFSSSAAWLRRRVTFAPASALMSTNQIRIQGAKNDHSISQSYVC